MSAINHAGTGLVGVAEFLVTWWLQAAVLILVGGLAALVMRRRGPAVQSAIYRVTLIGVLVCPLLSQLFAGSGWSLLTIDLRSKWALQESVDDTSAQSEESLAGEVASQPALDVADVAEPEQFAGANPQFLTGSEFAHPNHVTPIPSGSDQKAVSVPVVPNGSTTSKASRGLRNSLTVITGCVVAVWLLGVLVLLSKLVCDLWSSISLRRKSFSADDVARSVCRGVAKDLQVAAPDVRVTPFLSSPCLFGHWRATVLMPEELPASSYREVFLHELAHLRRGDWLWSVLGRVATSLLWMQPLLWRLNRLSADVSEEVCDDFVLQYGGNREGYVRRLVEIAETRLPQQALAGVAMVSLPSTLTQRARRILDGTRELSTTAGRRFAATAAMVMLLVTASLGLCWIGKPQRAAAEDPVTTTDPVAGEKQAGKKDAESKDTDDTTLSIRGRVVTPQGNPFAGADVYLERNSYVRDAQRMTTETLAVAKSDSQGEFRFETDNVTSSGKHLQVAVKADGYSISTAKVAGGAIVEDPKVPIDPENLTIKLAGDTPVDGRILNTEGSPVAGVTVEVLRCGPAKSEEAVKEWIRNKRPELFNDPKARFMFYNDDEKSRTGFPTRGIVYRESSTLPDPVVSDEDGRFQLTGLGRNRKLLVRISGPSIAQEHAIVVTHEFEPFKAFSYWMDKVGQTDLTHYGAKFHFVARRTAPITGRIFDSESGKGLAGAKVAISKFAGAMGRAEGGYLHTTADAEGNFTIVGAPLGGGHRVRYLPAADDPYFQTDWELPKNGTSQAKPCELALRKVQWITGAVTDQDGKPVESIVQFFPYRENEIVKQYPNYEPRIMGKAPLSQKNTDGQGRFRIRAIPGTGVVAARLADRKKASEFLSDVPEDLLTKIGGEGMRKLHDAWSAKWYHCMREIEIPDGDEDTAIDFTLIRGLTQKIRMTDAGGKPIESVRVLGRKFPPNFEEPSESDIVNLIGIDPKHQRLLVFLHKDRKLGKAIVWDFQNRVDHVALLPCAEVRGRVVDEEGQPVAELQVNVSPTFEQDNWGRGLDAVTTDDDGKFSVLLPAGHPYRVYAYRRRGPNFSVDVKPRAGVVYDVGTVKHETKLDTNAVEATALEDDTQAAKSVRGSTLVAAGQPTKPLVFEGQVVDSDGKPIVGADLFICWSGAEADNQAIKPAGKSDADGRFRLEAKAGLAEKFSNGWIAVKHPGHALGWAVAAALETSGQLEEKFKQDALVYQRYKFLVGVNSGPIQLAADDVSVKGRLIDLQGKGIAGATIKVHTIQTGKDRTLSELEKLADTTSVTFPLIHSTVPRRFSPGDMMPPIKSGADGRFKITGIGKDRVVRFIVSGENLQTHDVYARTSGGPMRKIPMSHASEDFWQIDFFGDEVSLVVAPSRPVIGRVTDAKTGKPLAGAKINSERIYHQRMADNNVVHTRAGSANVQAISNADGSYTLHGLPPAYGTPLIVSHQDQDYLTKVVNIDTRGSGIQPVRQDLKLSKGLVISGRVVDPQTGLGVRGTFQFLSEKGKGPHHLARQRDTWSNAKGDFRVVVRRSKGVLAFRANDSSQYRLGPPPKQEVDPFAGRQRFHVTYAIDPAKVGDSVKDLKLTLEPTSRLTGIAETPDGKKLSDVFFVGRGSGFPYWRRVEDGNLVVMGLDKPRLLFAIHQPQELAASMTLSPDQGDKFRIKMQPWASIKGQLLDEEGQPLARVVISNVARGPKAFASPKEAMSSGIKYPLPLPPSNEHGSSKHVTDLNGRFEIIGMAPGFEYTLEGQYKRSLDGIDPMIARGLTLEPGEKRDLGKVILKRRKQ